MRHTEQLSNQDVAGALGLTEAFHRQLARKAIRSLKGLNDPSLITSPLTAGYFGEIRDKETGRIDELKFCRWLAQSDSLKPIEKNLAPEATVASGSSVTGKTEQAETSDPPGAKTATAGEHTTELLQVQILVRLPKWEKQWKDQTAALPELRQQSLDQESHPTGFVNQLFVQEYLTECERLVWGGQAVPELPAFEFVVGNDSKVGFPIYYIGVEVVAASFQQIDGNKPQPPPFMAKCDFVLSIPTFISANGDLGYTYGNPVISKLKDGTWVVMFASGYNNVGPGDGVGRLDGGEGARELVGSDEDAHRLSLKSKAQRLKP